MQQNNIYIEEVIHFSLEVADAVRNLTQQLDENFQPLTDDDLRFMISSPSTHLYIARMKEKNNIIGMITLIVYRIPYKMKAQLEDIVVDTTMRGKGIGKTLVQFAIDKAKGLGAKSLNFTSNPKREAANRLYENLGFRKRDTNVYRLTL